MIFAIRPDRFIGLLLLLQLGCAGVDASHCRFDPRPEDTEIIQVSGTEVTSRLAGTVLPFSGDRWLAQNTPLLEIQPAEASVSMTIPVRLDGTFQPPDLHDGVYCLRASARGFAVLVKRVRIKRGAKAVDLDVRLHLAI